MDVIVVSIVVFALALLLLVSGMRIAIALLLTGVVGFVVFWGNIGVASHVFFDSTNSFTLTAVPLFIFMGEILLRAGVTDKIYEVVSKWLSWAPGGLLHSNIASCAMFAAISGSSAATAATISTVAIPSLEKRGYDTTMSLGSLAAGGTLGILIPPSINMIVYGMISETSVGKLFMGGVIPGIILSVLFMIYIAIRVACDRNLVPREESWPTKSKILGLLDLYPVVFLGTIVLGGIFVGLVTPTEAAALGASAALLIALVKRRLSWRNLRAALLRSMSTSCMILFVYLGAMICASFFGIMGLPRELARVIGALDIGPYLVLVCVYVLYAILGCFLDGLAMMVLTVPIVVPVLVGLGFDPIWFGVVLVVLVELGMITPPVGINLFVIQGITQKPFGQVVRGVVPYFSLMLVCIALLTAFPVLVLWLPTLMLGG